MRHSKGQAALEFLSTYGFAFMALLVALGAISYLGIFNVADLQSDACAFPSGLVCRDYILNVANPQPDLPSAVNPLVPGNQPYARFIFTNTYGVNITVSNVALAMDQFPTVQLCGMLPGGSVDWGVSENRTFWCPVPAASFVDTQRYEGALYFNFTQAGGSYLHSVHGTLSLRAQ